MLEYITQIHDIEINTDNPLISGKHKEAAKIEEDCINYPMQKSKHFAFQDTMTMRGSAGKVDVYLNGEWKGDRTIPVGYYELHQKAIYHHLLTMEVAISYQKRIITGILQTTFIMLLIN